MSAVIRLFSSMLIWILATQLLAGCGYPAEPATSSQTLPLAIAGKPYHAALSTSDPHTWVRWDMQQDELPPGLALDSETGIIAGKTAKIGRYEIHFVMRDIEGTLGEVFARLEVIADDQPTFGDSSPIGSGLVVAQQTSSSSVGGLIGLLAAMPDGSWQQVSLNRFSDVWTPPDLRPLDVNNLDVVPSKIVAAWSGFAWDSNRSDLILYGGGHANYPGNDVYRWHGSTRLWERASLPSEIAKDASGNFVAIDGPDAAPVAAHTYDNNIFLPIADRFLTFGGAAYNSGGAYRRTTVAGQSRNTGPYTWDPAKGDPNKVGGTTGSHVQRVSPHSEVVGGQMWKNRDLPLSLANNTVLPAMHLEGCTGYATEGGLDVLYVAARLGYGTATQLFRYVLRDVNNPEQDSWTQVGGYWDSPQGQTVCTYDPVQKVFVKLGSGSTPFTYWDTTAPGGNTNYEKTVAYIEPTGEFLTRLANREIDMRYCGFDFDPQRRQYALWCGGSEVWMLTPPASMSTTGWILRKQIAAVGVSSAPTKDTGTGILGKWKYIPNLDAFMALQGSSEGNIWIYKPIGWKSPGAANLMPTVSWKSPSVGQQFTSGQVIPLDVKAEDPDGAVAAVDFFDGATMLAHLTAPPWRFDWLSATPGTHILKAVATDNQGDSQSSSTVNIQVNQGAGTVLAVLQDGLNGYAGTRDAHIASNATYSNAGETPSLLDIYVYNAIVLRFAIFQREGGPIPDNAVIRAAELSLYKTSSYGVTMSAYRLLCDWLELQVTWNYCRSGVSWAKPGAFGVGTDYQAVADGSGMITWDPGWLRIDVVTGLQAMQSGSPNYGWRLRRTAGDDINTKSYLSSEYTIDTNLRPKLLVQYTLPLQ